MPLGYLFIEFDEKNEEKVVRWRDYLSELKAYDYIPLVKNLLKRKKVCLLGDEGCGNITPQSSLENVSSDYEEKSTVPNEISSSCSKYFHIRSFTSRSQYCSMQCWRPRRLHAKFRRRNSAHRWELRCRKQILRQHGVQKHVPKQFCEQLVYIYSQRGVHQRWCVHPRDGRSTPRSPTKP